MASEIDIINIRHIESIQNISRKLRNENKYKYSEAAIQSCPYEKVFWKYATNLQKNTHAKVQFQ